MARNMKQPIVIKIGGSTFGSGDTVIEDLVALQKKGIIPVVAHGGADRTTHWLERVGILTSFVRGLRVTDAETLEIEVAVLGGLVNKELVAAITSSGGKAIGLSGADGGLIQGRIKSPELGYVGEVTEVNVELLETIIGAEYIPVIAPVGLKLPDEDDDSLTLLNINGDVIAAEVAAALEAEKLIFLTDVPGIYDSSGKLIAKLCPAEARALLDSGVISKGMITKVEACLRVMGSVPSAHIIDGRVPHALLAAIEGRAIGTEFK
jgi:acetylglutamate kinase